MGRQREAVKFWLDLKHADQQWIAEVVGELRKRRQLARTIRDGIALVVTLRQGDFSVLDALFPGVRQTPAMPSQEFHALLRAVHELQAQQGRAVPESRVAHLLAPGVESAREAPPSKMNAERVAQNFLSSVKGLASGFFD